VTRALILAAGGSRRFGAPKQLALLDGRPLLQHVIDVAAAYQPLVVLGAHADEIRRSIDVGEHIVNDQWADGQSTSLRAGVAALAGADRVLVLLGDMPFVNRAVIEAVLALPGTGRATYDGLPGHPVVLAEPVLARVADLRGDEGARSVMAGCATVEAAQLCDPTDFDTPDQLEARTR
jgi:molybdenum cofactor cytidylyltransferase